jgi:hypothetical protein
MLFACGDGNTDGGGCAAGTEYCSSNGQCVAIGSCVASACLAGQELCNGVCVASGSCQSGNPCSAGQIVCNGACYAGSVCPATTSPGVGGQSSINQTTVNSTGGVQTTTKTATGGTGNTATGGKTATGGTTATTTTAYVDPDPGTCADTASMSTPLNFQYSKTQLATTNNPQKTYGALANWWGVFNGQTVALSGLSFTVQNPNNATSSNGSDPIGYPSLMIGNYQTITTMSSNLPKLVSQIKSVPTVFNTNIGSISGDVNASMDVWFNTSSAPLGTTASAPTGGYLMVWQNKPGNKQPRGGVVQSGQTIGSVPGKWDVWSDGKCVSYVSTSVQSSLTFDLNDFIKHSVANNGVIKSSWYLGAIFAGFEIWSGGSNAKMNKFCTKVN